LSRFDEYEISRLYKTNIQGYISNSGDHFALKTKKENKENFDLVVNKRIDLLHFLIVSTVGTESLCRAESLCRNTCISYFRHLEMR
jgi:hypothetical protein